MNYAMRSVSDVADQLVMSYQSDLLYLDVVQVAESVAAGHVPNDYNAIKEVLVARVKRNREQRIPLL